MAPGARLIWVRTCERTGDAGLTCGRCGVSRPTLRTRRRRRQAEGEAGLVDRSRRRRLNSRRRRAPAPLEQLIVKLRKGRKPGVGRLRIERQRLHGVRLAIDTIHKALCRRGLNRLKRPRLIRKRWKRRARPAPGDRARTDVGEIGPGLRQYAAIDDRSRYQAVGLVPNRSAMSTLAFLDQVVEETPGSIQRIQTDRGRELFACKAQDKLRAWSITFRPIRPRSPHLNGKVERVRRTALEEFRPTVDLEDPALEAKLAERRRFHNREGPHDSLGGGAPIHRRSDPPALRSTGSAIASARRLSGRRSQTPATRTANSSRHEISGAPPTADKSETMSADHAD